MIEHVIVDLCRLKNKVSYNTVTYFGVYKGTLSSSSVIDHQAFILQTELLRKVN